MLQPKARVVPSVNIRGVWWLANKIEFRPLNHVVTCDDFCTMSRGRSVFVNRSSAKVAFTLNETEARALRTQKGHLTVSHVGPRVTLPIELFHHNVPGMERISSARTDQRSHLLVNCTSIVGEYKASASAKDILLARHSLTEPSIETGDIEHSTSANL